VAIVASVLFMVIWWLVPPLLYRHTGAQPDARLKAITDTRTALLAGLVGVGAVLTFWQSSRTHRLTKQGQITDRYAKAVDQLGSGTLDVRLGGIYALERITHDSPEDQATIVEVLSAFVRVHSSSLYRLRKHEAERGPTGWKTRVSSLEGAESLQDEIRLFEDEQDRADKHVLIYPLPEDVQAAVTVLGRIPQRRGVARQADLAKTYLREVKLTLAHPEEDAHLEGTNFEGAHLEGAVASNAHLEGANLKGAHLQGAHLEGAHLEGAHLEGAELGAADLTGAHLKGALLGSAKGLTVGQVKSAHWDLSTRLPDDVRHQLQHPSPAASEGG
jgi:hypothetical protein